VREGDVRRYATMDDFRRLPAGPSRSRSSTRPAGHLRAERHASDSRHSGMIYSLQTVTDKIYMGNVVSGPTLRRRHYRHDLISFSGVRAAIDATPCPPSRGDQLQFPAALVLPDLTPSSSTATCAAAGRAHPCLLMGLCPGPSRRPWSALPRRW